jgi:hypothetical protein
VQASRSSLARTRPLLTTAVVVAVLGTALLSVWMIEAQWRALRAFGAARRTC